ncbi:2-dehydropantoate 2-reductase (Ketopantoate reductase) (KPA reductase) (KPR) [Coemansia sp. RSA 2336]|nr:2-dehydropantoate 2-reductase (Ketopantoate reductase) (KPA reductase) (KPR) [Coemansia sp. RSA 2336]
MASSGEGGRLSRIYVLGAGAVGLLFAGYLRKAGYPITLLLRSPAAVERFEQQSSRIGIANDWVRTHPSRQRLMRPDEEIACSIDDVQAETPTENDTVISKLIIATKAQHVHQAYSQVQSRLDPSSAVLMLQNGMGILEAIQRQFYAQSQNQPAFIVGTNAHGCLRHSNEEFVVHHTAMGSCKIALHAPVAPPQSAMDMLAALSALPLNVSVVNWSDLQLQMLLKLAANAVINPATALAGCQNGTMLQPELSSVQAFVTSACSEIASIYARAHPHLHSELSAAAIEEYVLNIVHVTAQNRSSMLQDITAARPTESDWISGYLVRLGQQHGVPTPINTSLYALIKLRESAF